ncbi:MAG: response regulator, partial [Proteobacteria bacterium]|nr:response regulator [Pseudomonadota bacterium]
GDERANIRFRIEDTGVGIPLEQQEIIFHPFEQAEEMKLKTEGTGLGLAISNELVLLMGGTLHLESAPGKGSIFSFDLVFRLSTARDLDSLPPDAIDITGYKGKKRTILIIDDNAANRKVMEDMLVPLGFETAHAGHGRDVLQRCRKIRPDIVFMDLVMPDIDGFEATEAIRRVFGPDRLPIIAFSASTMAQYREKALAAGCNGFLAKPVSRSELLDILQHHLRIEWLHETAALPAGESNETRKALTAPPPGELAELQKLVLYGNMRKIIAWADEKAGGDPSMTPFSDRVIAMAKEYQEQEMLRFIEGLMEAEKKDLQPG